MMIFLLEAQAFKIYFMDLEQMNSFLTSHMFYFKKVALALLFSLISPSSFIFVLIITSTAATTTITATITKTITIFVIFTMSTSGSYY